MLLACYRLVLATIGRNQGNLYHIDHVWQIWLITVVLAFALYLPTKLFGQYKRKSNKAWVRYF